MWRFAVKSLSTDTRGRGKRGAHTKKDFPNGKTVTFQYHSNSYYDIRMEQTASGWNCTLQLQPFEQPFEKQLVEEIFEDYKKGSESYIAKWNEQEVAVIVFQKMNWNKTLLIHDLYVEEGFKNRGIGQYLMNYAKQRAHELNVRAIVLETQTSNVPAIQFYLKNGFALVGLNTVSYSNEDIENKEVRIEMAYPVNAKGIHFLKEWVSFAFNRIFLSFS